MCKKHLVLISILSLLGSAGLGQGQTIAHWKFDGVIGEKIVTDTDVESGYVATKFYDATYGANAAKDVFYGLGNSVYDSSGSSADFQNDPGGIAFNDPGVGMFVSDTGANTPLDLSTFGAFTIEAFIHPYTLRQSVIVRKYGGAPGQYYIDLRDNGDTQFSINADTNAAAAGAGAIKANEWNHIAAVFDETDGAAPMKMYVNGELKGQATYRDRPGDTPRALGIGCIIRDNLNPPGNSGQFFNGRIDEVRISAAALSVDDFLLNMAEGTSRPSPADGATDVPLDTGLSWMSGRDVLAYDVYFGTRIEDVANASRTDPMGVLVSQGQEARTYEPVGPLMIGQTYFWRIDAESPADAGAGTTISKGDVWVFTVEPPSYEMTNITATASSSQSGDTGPQKTVDNSGLNAMGLHSTDAKGMWLSDAAGPQPAWIQYEFDRIYKLDEMWVWNQNQVVEGTIGFGAKAVTIEYSVDGADWEPLGDFEFARAGGLDNYAHNTTVHFAGVSAKYVRLIINTNWGGIVPQYGLSEVRFFYVPVLAREPQPADGATDVSVETTLDWRSGREAVTHDVFLGSSKKAVLEGTALVATVPQSLYEPTGLNLGTTYYWKINEVNEAAQPAVWPGDVWTFTTQAFIPIDDFESYTDEDGKRIYQTWADGWTNQTGSIVGYMTAPFAEQKIVNSGRQSMPVEYNNVSAPWYSQTERIFASPQDWTAFGADTLALSFRGRPIAFLEQADGSIVMSGAGADIAGMADEFRFASKPLSGNGSIIVRVDSLGNTNAWAKAGVMIRESLDAGSRFAAVYLTPGNGCRFQIRTAVVTNAMMDDAVATAEQKAVTAPYWLKLERSGNSFSGFYSADGKTWKAMAWNPQTIAMGANAYVGLAVTSRSAGNPTTAKFSGVAATGVAAGPWQVKAIGVEQPGNDPAPLYVALEDSTGRVKAVSHLDAAAVGIDSWLQWQIPLSTFSSAGLNVAKIKAIYIGVGDRDNPKAGGAGLIYIDDVLFGRAPKAPVAKIAHWQFNGTLGAAMAADTDIAGGYVASKFKDATFGSNGAVDVLYGPANLAYDASGTSADLMNDPVANDPGVGLLVLDTGFNTPLDLSGAAAFTIEAFIHPYAVRQAVVVRKFGGAGRYYIDLRPDGSLGFAINADTNVAVAGAGTVKANEWCHVAAVYDEADATSPMQLYVNGELKAAAAFRARVADSTNSLGIGCITRDNLNPSANSGQFFHGRIDEVRISGAALSVDEFLLNLQDQ